MQSFIQKESKIHAMNTQSAQNNTHGFTLVELMIVVFLTAIAVIAIYRGYTSFSHSADAQEQIVEMQQNLRIGMYWLEKDLRRAGMTEEDNSKLIMDASRMDYDAVTFLTAINYMDLTQKDDPIIEFAMDLGSRGLPVSTRFAGDGKDNDGDDEIDEEDEQWIGDGDINDDGERIYYRLYSSEDANQDGVLDAGEDANDNGLLDLDLERAVWSCDTASGTCDYDSPQTVIRNVSALNFTFLEEDGVTEISSPLDTPEKRSLVDTVEITMVVRTTNEDYRIKNNETYTNQLGTWSWAAPGDNFRRRAMSMRVKVRNANLL